MTAINTKKNVHTISLRVANKPGALMRIASVFARRGYNIESLIVSPDVDSEYSRMTITAKGDPYTLDQIIKQTSKLIDVIHAGEHTDIDAIHRELSLIKIKNNPANKSVVNQLIKKYKAQVHHEDKKTIIISQADESSKLDELENILRKYGVIEMVRSGMLVMAKGVETT